MARSLAAASVLALLLAAPSRAEVPAWAADPCAGLDCSWAVAGVGEADLVPDVRVSSAVAYAQAARALAQRLGDSMAMRERLYTEEAGSAGDSSTKDLVESPLGAALTKTYAGTDSDLVTVTVRLQRLAAGTTVFAQEAVDASSGTLRVRLAMTRAAVEYARAASTATAAGREAPSDALRRADGALAERLGPGASAWPGRDARMATQLLRVGGHDEVTLLVQDRDAGVTWIEHWPTGGADLLTSDGRTEKLLFDKPTNRWVAAPPPPPAIPAYAP